MRTFKSQVIPATKKLNNINRTKKHFCIEIHLEFILHYITLTSSYIVITNKLVTVKLTTNGTNTDFIKIS